MIERALELPYEERFEIASAIEDSLHPPGENISPAAWFEELDRRQAALDSGQSRTYTWDEVQATMAGWLARK